MEERLVRRCVGVTLSMNTTHQLSEDHCQCEVEEGRDSAVCKYEAEQTPNLLNTFPWITYVVITELIINFIPSLLLIVLNIVMINRFLLIN